MTILLRTWAIITGHDLPWSDVQHAYTLFCAASFLFWPPLSALLFLPSPSNKNPRPFLLPCQDIVNSSFSLEYIIGSCWMLDSNFKLTAIAVCHL